MSGIPSPTMPPRRSSIAQAAGISSEPAAPPAVEPPPTQTASGASEVAKPNIAPADAPVAVEAPAPPMAGGVDSTRRAGSAARQRSTASKPAPAAPLIEEKEKAVLLKLGPELKQRLVNTTVWTGPRSGLRTQQAFIRRAIAELCERMEKEYNGGEPFPTVATPNDD